LQKIVYICNVVTSSCATLHIIIDESVLLLSLFGKSGKFQKEQG